MDDVARWLVESARLPQYEQAFCDNDVDGDMLLDLVARDLLGELVESRLHQSRLRSQLAKFARRASAGGGAAVTAEGEHEGETEADAEAEGKSVSGPGTRRVAEAMLPDCERPRQRARHGEPADASAVERVAAATAPEPAAARLVAIESPAHGVLVYARLPLADLEARLCAARSPHASFATPGAVTLS